MRPTPIIIGLQLLAALVFFLGLLLWLSGDWRWVEGWIFGVWWVSLAAAILLWLHYRDPALYAERFRMPGSGGESRSDLAILIGMKVCFLALFVVPPLGVRFGWTPRLPLWCEVCGAILLFGGSFPFFRAFTDNTYASQLVRSFLPMGFLCRPTPGSGRSWSASPDAIPETGSTSTSPMPAPTFSSVRPTSP